MIEVIEESLPWRKGIECVGYNVLVDGQSVARYPSRDDAEAHAERLKEQQR